MAKRTGSEGVKSVWRELNSFKVQRSGFWVQRFKKTRFIGLIGLIRLIGSPQHPFSGLLCYIDDKFFYMPIFKLDKCKFNVYVFKKRIHLSKGSYGKNCN